MDDSAFKIPKTLRPVTLWVHPEGQVLGSLFLHMPTQDFSEGERPADALNDAGDFLPVKRDEPDDVCFYNKSAIVRISYWDEGKHDNDQGRPQACRLTLMDGTVLYGDVRKVAPEERSRLYDYLNDTQERFFELHNGGGEVILVNKSYVVSFSPESSAAPRKEPVRHDPSLERVIEFAA